MRSNVPSDISPSYYLAVTLQPLGCLVQLHVVQLACLGPGIDPQDTLSSLQLRPFE